MSRLLQLPEAVLARVYEFEICPPSVCRAGPLSVARTWHLCVAPWLASLAKRAATIAQRPPPKDALRWLTQNMPGDKLGAWIIDLQCAIQIVQRSGRHRELGGGDGSGGGAEKSPLTEDQLTAHIKSMVELSAILDTTRDAETRRLLDDLKRVTIATVGAVTALSHHLSEHDAAVTTSSSPASAAAAAAASLSKTRPKVGGGTEHKGTDRSATETVPSSSSSSSSANETREFEHTQPAARHVTALLQVYGRRVRFQSAVEASTVFQRDGQHVLLKRLDAYVRACLHAVAAGVAQPEFMRHAYAHESILLIDLVHAAMVSRDPTTIGALADLIVAQQQQQQQQRHSKKKTRRVTAAAAAENVVADEQEENRDDEQDDVGREDVGRMRPPPGRRRRRSIDAELGAGVEAPSPSKTTHISPLYAIRMLRTGGLSNYTRMMDAIANSERCATVAPRWRWNAHERRLERHTAEPAVSTSATTPSPVRVRPTPPAITLLPAHRVTHREAERRETRAVARQRPGSDEIEFAGVDDADDDVRPRSVTTTTTATMISDRERMSRRAPWIVDGDDNGEDRRVDEEAEGEEEEEEKSEHWRPRVLRAAELPQRSTRVEPRARDGVERDAERHSVDRVERDAERHSVDREWCEFAEREAERGETSSDVAAGPWRGFPCAWRYDFPLSPCTVAACVDEIAARRCGVAVESVRHPVRPTPNQEGVLWPSHAVARLFCAGAAGVADDSKRAQPTDRNDSKEPCATPDTTATASSSTKDAEAETAARMEERDILAYLLLHQTQYIDLALLLHIWRLEPALVATAFSVAVVRRQLIANPGIGTRTVNAPPPPPPPPIYAPVRPENRNGTDRNVGDSDSSSSSYGIGSGVDVSDNSSADVERKRRDTERDIRARFRENDLRFFRDYVAGPRRESYRRTTALCYLHDLTTRETRASELTHERLAALVAHLDPLLEHLPDARRPEPHADFDWRTRLRTRLVRLDVFEFLVGYAARAGLLAKLVDTPLRWTVTVAASGEPSADSLRRLAALVDRYPDAFTRRLAPDRDPHQRWIAAFDASERAYAAQFWDGRSATEDDDAELRIESFFGHEYDGLVRPGPLRLDDDDEDSDGNGDGDAGHDWTRRARTLRSQYGSGFTTA